MAATNKNMTFDVNLLPATTGDHNLGSSNLKWNLFVNQINGTAPVTGIKGNSESSYRTGQVNLTAENVGAVALTGDTMTGNLLGNSTATLGSTTNPFHQLVLGGATNANLAADSTNPRITFQESNNGSQPVHLIYSDYDSYRSPAGLKIIGGTSASPAWLEVEGDVYAAAFKGNADTATAFSSNKTISLTGDVTGSASSTGGWSIATTIGEGKVTNAMLAGSIANGKLANSSIKIGNKTISLGGTATLADIGVSYPVTSVAGNTGAITADTLRTSLGLSNAMHFLGVTTTNISTGTANTTATVAISGSNITAAAGDVVLYGSQEYVWGNSKWNLLGDESSYKVKQTAKSDPTASTTTSTTFIDTISQDANGVITATKKTLPSYVATSAGVTAVTWDSTNKKLTRTINGTAADVVTIGTIKTALGLVKGDVGLGSVDNTADADKTVKYANMLTGFTSRANNFTWGNQTGTAITVMNDSTGGSVGFRRDNPASGQMSMSIDGTIYIKEGRQNIAEAVKGFSVSGQTVTYTTLWGSTGTFTTQDTKNTAGSTNSESKLYLIGATSQAANPQSYSYQYTYATNGLLSSPKVGLNLKGTEKVHLEWNDTDQSIDFIFV